MPLSHSPEFTFIVHRNPVGLTSAKELLSPWSTSDEGGPNHACSVWRGTCKLVNPLDLQVVVEQQVAMQQAALVRKAAPRRAAAAAPMMPMSRTKSRAKPSPAKKAAPEGRPRQRQQLSVEDKKSRATTSHAHSRFYTQQDGHK